MHWNMREWRNGVLNSKKRIAIPIMTHPGLHFTGKKTIDAVKSGECNAAAVIALDREFPAGAATMMMDLSVEAEAFGSPILFKENEVPTVTSRLVSDGKSISGLAVPGLQSGRLPEYIKAARLITEGIHDRPVFAGCIGPFSLAGRLFDVAEIMTDILVDPEAIHELLGKCSRFLTEYVLEYKRAGVNGIIMAEPAAGMLSSGLCREFSSRYIREIVAKTRDDEFLFILHNCGNTDSLLAAMQVTEADGYHFGNANHIEKTLQEIPSSKLVLGNLDPVRVLKTGKPEDVRRETALLLEKTAPYPNFILSTGCDTPPGVPLENIRAFYATLAVFNENH